MKPARRTVVWRTVFPTADIGEVLPLYVDDERGAAEPIGRNGVRVRAGGSVSLGSYFNAFPAAYWRAQTDVDTVHLRVRASGHGEVSVWGSDAAARAHLVARHVVDGRTDTEFAVQLHPFATGGALWLDLNANPDAELLLDEAEWSVDTDLEASATVVMATYNRPTDCVRQLTVLGRDPRLAEVVDRVVVVDQGDDLVEAQPDFIAAAATLGERLVIVRQPNFGGSGGFSRGMQEALGRQESSFILLLDDDAICEPEAIVRAIRFADAARSPTIVGGGMLHLDDRAVLYAQSEQWDHRIGWVRLKRPGAYDHDFARVGFRAAPFFHATQGSDFTGWWMCLIPVSVIRRIGFALPVFLKGDDIEFALRAREHGVQTVSVPGIALWHMGWKGKSPTRTWEAYFLHRNRLITELLHSPHRRPIGLLLHSLLGDVKPLLTLQYSAVALRAQAICDVLAGPDPLVDWLGTRAGFIRGLWQSFADATAVDDPVPARPGPEPPRGRLRSATTLARSIARHLFIREVGGSPQIHVTADRLGWWTFTSADAALVDTADGVARVRYQRSRDATRRALWRSIRLHVVLWARWPRLAQRFRARAGALASPGQWSQIFEK